MIVVVLFKIREVVFKNGLNNIPTSGFIARYTGFHTMFKQERQEEISFNKKLVEYPPRGVVSYGWRTGKVLKDC